MANIKSAKKRIRSSETKRLRNRYQHKSMRKALKNIKISTDNDEAVKAKPKLEAMVDKLAKKNIIHKNKAARLKSAIAKKVNTLKATEKKK